MEILPISEVKTRLNDLVDRTVTTHEHVTITKNGRPAAVLISADEWEAMQETMYWLSQDGVRDDVARGRAEDAAGETLTEADVRARLGRTRRT